LLLGIFPAGVVCYWLQLGRVDIEEAESLSLDRRRGGDQGKAVSGVESGGHLVEGEGGEIAQQAVEAVNRGAIGGELDGAMAATAFSAAKALSSTLVRMT